MNAAARCCVAAAAGSYCFCCLYSLQLMMMIIITMQLQHWWITEQVFLRVESTSNSHLRLTCPPALRPWLPGSWPCSEADGGSLCAALHQQTCLTCTDALLAVAGALEAAHVAVGVHLPTNRIVDPGNQAS